MAWRRYSVGELLRTVATLAVIGAAFTLCADAQPAASSEKAYAEQAKLFEQVQQLSRQERGALERAFGPEFWLTPQLDLGRVLAGLNRAGSPLRDAAASPGPRVSLQDGSPCYYFNHFFERDLRATIEEQDPAGPGVPEPVDRYGTYSGVILLGGTHTFTAKCGPMTTSVTLTTPGPSPSLVFANRPPVLASLVAMVGTTVVAGAPRNSAVTLVANATDPDGDTLQFTWVVNAGSIGTIAGNTAQWILPNSPGLAFAYVLVTDRKGAVREGSTVVSTDAGIVPAPPAGAAPAPRPSDDVNAPDHFLTFFSVRDLLVFPAKNTDSRQGACQYYVAIGAVQACSPGGELVGTQLTFAAWKAKWGLDTPTAGFSAVYANIRDLDLERDMHGVTNANGTAYYVCNYPHVRDGQPDTNLLNVQRGENLVACVAMEHSPSPGVSAGQPFTKFLVFGPGGQLLPSVNLDQRGEKFLPGVCVVCHGARHGFTRFGEDGSMSPDLAAQFLPFDLGNFAYAASSGPLSRAGQEVQFRNLNLTLLKTDPRPALVNLLNVWYPNPATSPFTDDAVPPGWSGHETLYKTVLQKYCRTCHVAMAASGGRDFAFPSFSDFDRFGFELATRACGTTGGIPRARWSMPNSKVTFDQFWNDSTAVAALQQYLRDGNHIQPEESCAKP
jgi:hypothetical protein